ncbi:MAG: RNA polymerase sigma factor [Patescibacteria group bacterium]|nr:RNA polymerase sigma factor [Patescibacteria group bacterium]
MKNIDNLEEKLILKRAQAGEKEAFSEIYDFYVVKIFRFIYLKTNSKEVAEDLTSETFLKCWRYIKKQKKEEKNDESIRKGNLGSFLYKIARNLIIDFYRKKKEISLDMTERENENIIDDRQDILAEINKKQEIQVLRKCLDTLKDDYQEILILRYVEDLSMSEIAEITGKSDGSIRVLIHRATKLLEKVMKRNKETE